MTTTTTYVFLVLVPAVAAQLSGYERNNNPYDVNPNFKPSIALTIVILAVASSSSGTGSDDSSMRSKLPAWEILKVVPFVVNDALTTCSHQRLSLHELTIGERKNAGETPTRVDQWGGMEDDDNKKGSSCGKKMDGSCYTVYTEHDCVLLYPEYNLEFVVSCVITTRC